jgi:hypothetical protein
MILLLLLCCGAPLFQDGSIESTCEDVGDSGLDTGSPCWVQCLWQDENGDGNVTLVAGTCLNR